MRQEDLLFNERTGEMYFANAHQARRPAPPAESPVSAPAPATKPTKAKKPKAPSPPPEPPPGLVVPATHREMVERLLGTTRKMCRYMRREQPAPGMPSQHERGERIVALIERLHRGEAVAIEEALEVESMASLLWMASTRENYETGRDEYHCLSFHAAEVMDWALRCAIGRGAVNGFAAACQRFAAFMREP